MEPIFTPNISSFYILRRDNVSVACRLGFHLKKISTIFVFVLLLLSSCFL